MSLASAWDACSEEDHKAGLAAYPSYHDGIKRFSSFYGVGFVPSVEAFAALSPNNDYHGNLRSLSSVLLAHVTKTPLSEITVPTYSACAERAMTYLSGEVSFLDTVRGRKITAFRHNILYPQTSRLVTVDGHMIGLYFDKPITMREAALSLRAGLYDKIAHEVALIAKRHNLPCPQVQATLWMHRKRTLGVKHSTQIELFSGDNRWLEVPDPLHYPPYQLKIWRDWLRHEKRKLARG